MTNIEVIIARLAANQPISMIEYTQLLRANPEEVTTKELRQWLKNFQNSRKEKPLYHKCKYGYLQQIVYNEKSNIWQLLLNGNQAIVIDYCPYCGGDLEEERTG